ncbi:hypothetical protein Zm00014a_036774 [Zea mays]|uniref:Uncharacterized protein n=1 Tax=Zea mays TaxID=4577 RepID=A0A3L6E364_MAIZE|nr:hypothetical protein Zm00014a_036774 [Zea mays]
MAATGMVADVIGKEYTRSAANFVSKHAKCLEGRDGESDGDESGGRKDSVEEAEQFLCSMLGDNFELGMGVVRDVPGEPMRHFFTCWSIVVRSEFFILTNRCHAAVFMTRLNSRI